MKYGFGLWLVLMLTACGYRGCEQGEQIVVLYRGGETLELQAAVVRENEAVGYIKSLQEEKHGVRAVLLVRQAAAFTDKDRFRPLRDPAGKMGLQAEPGGGKPLASGSELEADPKWTLRKHYAAMKAPDGITLPSGTPLPFPKALTAPVIPRATQIRKEFTQKVERALKLKSKEPRQVDSHTMATYERLQEQLADTSPEEAKLIMEAEGKPFLEELRNKARQARGQRDSKGYRDYRQLINRIEKLDSDTNRTLERLEAESKRKPRERWVPPDFR